jgi:hypothetical protein
VRVTGNVGFARTYLLSERIQAGATTTTTVTDDGGPTQVGEPVTFTAIVARTVSKGGGVATGTVQFLLDGAKVGDAVKLDSNGRRGALAARACYRR